MSVRTSSHTRARIGRAAVLACAAALCVAWRGAVAAPHSSTALFSTYAPIDLQIDAPLSKLFAAGDDEASVHGSVSYADGSGRERVVRDVRIERRGNSSRRAGECTFPKLKLSFASAHGVDNSIFDGVRAVKIGTHCGEAADGELTKAGRWANQKSPWREALVYRLLAIAGVPTLRARPARIEYRGVDDGPIRRDAMLLEDDADAARRLDAHEMKDFSNAAADFAPDDAARLAFGEAMIGNFDWCLKFSPDDRYRCDARHPLWNLLALDRRNGTALPLMFDFDLSGMVTGRHPWYHRAFTDLYAGPGKRPLTEVVAQLQHARTVFPRAVLDRTRALFAARRGDLYAAVHDAAVDDTGRTFASEYLDAFFHAIGRDEDFYLPVVVDGTTHAWIDPGRHQLACEGDSHVPVGTPVGTIVARDRRFVRAPLLDAQWKWTNTCPAIRQQAVWIEADAISADYPPRQD